MLGLWFDPLHSDGPEMSRNFRALVCLSRSQCDPCAAAEEADVERISAEARSKGSLEDLLVFRETDVHPPIPEPQNLNKVLDEGVRRLQDKGTWKAWQWPAGGQEFFDAESFR